jgi:hypothetical protein
MKKVVYLFKTDNQPFHFCLLNPELNEVISIYGINPNCTKYKRAREAYINQIYVDPSFQAAPWFWETYMPILHNSGTSFYDLLL